MKRPFDLIFSLMALMIFTVPCIVIVLIIKFFYRHPVVFRQERTGLNRLPFEIFKFQTLIHGKPTRLGAVLRASGLDELPQFINVLKGDMSIVGPRALTQEDIDRLEWNNFSYDIRWKVKPGITGLAQLSGGLGKAVSWFWDKKYLSTKNLFLDFKIVAASFLVNIFGKKTVRNIINKNWQPMKCDK